MYADDTQLAYPSLPYEFEKMEKAVKTTSRRSASLASISVKLNQPKTTVTKFGNVQQLARLPQERLVISDNQEVDILNRVAKIARGDVCRRSDYPTMADVDSDWDEEDDFDDQEEGSGCRNDDGKTANK
ncbi:hypothetical protein Tcan_08532 [Toxocara canis]|uniref:Uncharacterized protein n=1 Tax=Toxocara canis TaxID=6265 RepID=A0A0B2VCS7_TOXCA|nr:hypothetical protein Tcan_08532 [Toxocara canis]